MGSPGAVPSAVIQILLNNNLGDHGRCKVFGRSSSHGMPPFGLHSRQTVNASTVADVRKGRKEEQQQSQENDAASPLLLLLCS